ncbi:MAG: sigma 54-dependent Fis family transcriptional regulator [Myxococcaceae bacterium]|nr:sigma 54-dependent Fis family transcriptional regulator [Myxococcaceae bacterium]
MTELGGVTELLQTEVARFPRARLYVAKGPDKGAEVLLEGQTVTVGSDEGCALKLTDPAVSRRHFELSGGPGGYRLRDLKSTNGVFIEDVQVLDVRLTGKARITLGRATELRFEPERQEISWPLSASDRFGEALGRSTAMRRVFAVLEKAAPTDSAIVLEGETGVGKELLARTIHEKSARAEGPFVVVDVGALSEQVVESDLFGHELSAFAQKGVVRPGAFEEAEGGTLFLDEVAELPLGTQARLLRVLESREIKRGNATVKVDARVICSTQKDLEAEVRAGRFREDLFFRLAVFRVRVPALRERPEDIPMLARLFESKMKSKEPIPSETIEMLTRHDWPGNVRELRNVVERLCAFPDLGANALLKALGKSSEEETSDARLRSEMMKTLFALPYHEAKERVLESFEKTYLNEHLRAANGVVTRAAQRVKLPRQSVHRMMRRLGLQGREE